MKLARTCGTIGKHTCHLCEGRLTGLLPQRGGGRRHIRTAIRAAAADVDVLVVGGGHAGQHRPYTLSSMATIRAGHRGSHNLVQEAVQAMPW